jgi:hypothetical protein
MTAPSHGYAKLLDGGSIQITFAYHNGDQGSPKARRNTSQQPAKGHQPLIVLDVLRGP